MVRDLSSEGDEDELVEGNEKCHEDQWDNRDGRSWELKMAKAFVHDLGISLFY